MITEKIPRPVCLILILLFLFLVPSIQPGEAVTRGEMVHTVLDALDIPPWNEKITFSDVPLSHPHSRYIETARALALIYPSERFHPDIEATRAETLMFALKAMGWEHEADLALWVYADHHSDLPEYIAPYHSLARRIVPSPPDCFLFEPENDLKMTDLPELNKWLRKCIAGITWDETVKSSPFSLLLHRQGVGKPPGAWAIQVFSSPERSEAEKVLHELGSKGMKVFLVDNVCSFTVNVGPFVHYAQAWEKMSSLNTTLDGFIVPAGNSAGRSLFWAAIVVSEAPSFPSVVTAPSLGSMTLPLSLIRSKSGGFAAINGGFFYRDKPVGTLISGKEILATPVINRSAVGWDRKGNVFFGNGTHRTVLYWGQKGKLVLTDFNRPPRANGAALFSPGMGSFARFIPGDGIEVLISRGRVKKLGPTSISTHFMGPEEMLIVARGMNEKALESLKPGMKISLDTEFFDDNIQKADVILQAGPMLLEKGKPLDKNEGLSSGITDRRHPRTLIGYDGKSCWFIVVDGRNSWHSSGITLEEARIIMDHLGITDGLNLDGGGSSQIQWMDHTVNMLPGGHERPLPYGLVFNRN